MVIWIWLCVVGRVACLSARRPYLHVPYGESAPAGVVSISVDGKVPGTSLDLTHWTNNETPEAFYADTSTEIAVNFARAAAERGEYAAFDGAVVVNNHYDTDGLLSALVATNPEAALPFAEHLIAGAEAGDFGEWSSDVGVKLDCACGALADGGAADGGAAAALERLPEIVADLALTGGAESEALWGPGYEAVLESWEAVVENWAMVSEGDGRVAVVHETPRVGRLHPAAIHRALPPAWQRDECARVLRASFFCGAWKYEYEKVGHGWVTRLRSRRPAGDVDGAALAARLGPGWEKGGHGGLVALCRTSAAVETPPDVLLETLLDVDAGAV